ncbi:hypothetical protein [Oceanobacillus jeddahense]|uniref:1,4-dihydroxy-2-naphthoyl-CoA synthase n=1 Tax=Oceanobacillus jeddahense TaxID=1462527 RepID=A0ABY5JP13_9BACI|nr:hypothetical protein [Oceanobacillus jeddahense]UUI02045.1 hypothetical protein NP439_18655 [Oceanobacillus jeddahense]
MECNNIQIYKDGAIGVIKMNRPDVRNALNAMTIQEISSALKNGHLCFKGNNKMNGALTK